MSKPEKKNLSVTKNTVQRNYSVLKANHASHHITSQMQERLVNCNRFEDALDIQMLIWTLSEQFRCLSSTTQSYGFYYSLQQLLKCCCMKFINILFSSGRKTSTNILIYRRKNKALQLWSQSVNLYYYSSIFLLSVHLFIYLPM